MINASFAHTLRRTLSAGIFLLSVVLLSGQKAAAPVNGDNIVPNPGFERFGNIPIGWTYKGADYGRVVKYWFSATTASPDVYGPGVRVPVDWAEKGFGKQTPHSGKSMSGITLYGCVNGKPHCREYIEIQLAEPLVIGQYYQVDFWVCPMAKSLYINHIGAYFSVQPVERKTDEILVRDAQVVQNNIVLPAKKGKWVKISGQFKATYEAEHILIGNFSDDEHTLTQVSDLEGYNYAYYYVDDVSVRKIPPYAVVPVKLDDLTKVTLTKGKTVPLKNIYFEFDRDELMPRSYVELDKLLKIMKQSPKLVIDIIGHTDSMGEDDYNIDLSRRRAQAVVDFLIKNGISATRLAGKGMGESRPVATNETDEGRAQNRRVEFVVRNL